MKDISNLTLVVFGGIGVAVALTLILGRPIIDRVNSAETEKALNVIKSKCGVLGSDPLPNAYSKIASCLDHEDKIGRNVNHPFTHCVEHQYGKSPESDWYFLMCSGSKNGSEFVFFCTDNH